MDVDEGELSSLLSSTSLVFVGTVISAFSNLIERAIVGRAYSLSAFGEFNVGLAVLSLGSTLSLIGLNHGVTRYISRKDSDSGVRGVWLTGAIIALCLSAVVTVVLYVNVATVSRVLFDDRASPRLLELFVLVIPLATIKTIGISAIRGMENTTFKIYVNDLLDPLIRMAVLVGLIALGVGITATAYAYLVGTALAVLASHYLFHRLTSVVGSVRLHGRTLVAFCAPLVLSMLLSTLLTRMDTLMVAYFSSTAQVGLYASAYPLANSLLLVLSCFGYLYLPLTSRLDADGRDDEVHAVYQLTTKWSYLLSFPLFLVFVSFPGDVLSIVYGGEFAGGGIVLAILSLGFFTSASLGRNRETLSALGDTRQILVADLLALSLNFVVNVALIPPFGIAGAAAASALAFLARNVAINVVLWHRHEITPFSAKMVRMYVLVPVALLPLGVIAATTVSLSLTLLPLVLVGSGIAGLAVVAVAGCLQAEDAVALEFFEGLLGVEIPYVRNFIP